MNWTEPKEPTQGVSHYTHVISETPLGQCLIEWKGWKQSDSYSVTIGNDYIGEGDDLEDGKRLAKEWLLKKYNELSKLLVIISDEEILNIAIDKASNEKYTWNFDYGVDMAKWMRNKLIGY